MQMAHHKLKDVSKEAKETTMKLTKELHKVIKHYVVADPADPADPPTPTDPNDPADPADPASSAYPK
jgi:hypothetical protein